MTFFIDNANAIVQCNSLAGRLDLGPAGASIRIYGGGGIPADADAAVLGTLLAELTMSAVAFGAAIDSAPGATATAATITGDSSADATGTAEYFRIFQSDDLVNAHYQGQVGTSGQELNLNTVSIVIAAQVDITAMTLFQPES